MTDAYPWHASVWEKAMRWNRRLPHALLLEGPRGVGKVRFAERWARALMCASPEETGDACGVCRECLWLASGTHPDFSYVSVQTDEAAEGEGATKRRSVEISVAQIRAITDALQLSRHSAARRVILIHPAEAMNRQAANALLKVLEEPGQDIVFLLVTHQSAAVLPTIRSRCQRLSFGLPTADMAEAWLETQGIAHPGVALAAAGGAPLTAAVANTSPRSECLRALARPDRLDYILLAEKCAAIHQDALLWLQTWVFDLLSYRVANKIRYNEAFEREINGLTGQFNVHSLSRYYKALIEARRTADHPLNAQLVLETLFMQYRHIMTHSAKASSYG